MATITGNKVGSAPYLQLDWSVLKQEVANNRTQIKLNLYLKVDSTNISYVARGGGKITATPGGTYSFGAPGTSIRTSGRYLLKSQTLWVSHDGSGNRTVNLSASYALNITWGGSYVGTVTLNGSATLPHIARSFSISLKNQNLTTISSAEFGQKIRISLGRTNTNYRATIGYDFNGRAYTIVDKISYGEHDFVIPPELVVHIATASKASFKFWVKTYDGNTNIGTQSAWLTVNVPSGVKPTITGISILDQNQKSYDVGVFLEGISEIKTIVNAEGAQGSTITTITQKIGHAQANGSEHVWKSLGVGQHTLTVTVVDSRGRSTSDTRTITVEAYTPPKIQYFIPARTGGGTNTSVQAVVNVSVTDIQNAGEFDNPFTLKIERKPTSSDRWESVYSSIIRQPTYVNQRLNSGTNYAVDRGYDIRLTITDRYATSIALFNLGTSSVVMSWTDVGVGIGKIAEDSRVLDVGGQIYQNGHRVLDESMFDREEEPKFLGGRNYVMDSRKMSITSNSGSKSLRMKIAGDFLKDVNRSKGRYIIVSFDYEATNVSPLDSGRMRYGIETNMYKLNESGSRYFSAWVLNDSSNRKGRYFAKTKIEEGNDYGFNFVGLYIQANGNISISKPMIEIADIPSAWVPAPEDYQSQIDELKQIVARL